MEHHKNVFSPQEKLNNVFNAILDCSKFDGDQIGLFQLWESRDWTIDGLDKTNGRQEVLLYFKTIEKMGLLEMTWVQFPYTGNHFRGVKSLDVPSAGYITFKGLEYRIQMQETSANTNNCFVAIRFTTGYKEKLSAIQRACKKHGYDAFIVEDMPDKPLETINDKIIAGIKTSKFVIADLTYHSHGVYFEAGYALGRDMKTILTCNKKHLSKAHFDVNHYVVVPTFF